MMAAIRVRPVPATAPLAVDLPFSLQETDRRLAMRAWPNPLALIGLGLVDASVLQNPNFVLDAAEVEITSYSRLVATAIAPFLTYYVIKRGTGFILQVQTLVRTILSAVVMAAGVILLSQFSLSIALFLGVMLYLAALWATGSAPWTLTKQKEGDV